MGANSKIEWCNHTFNPWIGCMKVSPACDHCYAEALMDHRYGKVTWGGPRKRTSPSNWHQPIRWNKAAEKSGKRATVFCLSLGDIWDKEVPQQWRADLFDLMDKTPWLIWLLLSKRIGNAIRHCYDLGRGLPANAALGSTMVNQTEWDRDAEKLRYASKYLGALFSFVSVEPMLGPIDMGSTIPDWVICGGESGPDARPMDPDWPRSLRDQCAVNDVPYHFKQWGEWAPDTGPLPDGRDLIMAGQARCAVWSGQAWRYARNGYEPDPFEGDGGWVYRLGKKRAGRLLDGVEHNTYPRAIS